MIEDKEQHIDSVAKSRISIPYMYRLIFVQLIVLPRQESIFQKTNSFYEHFSTIDHFILRSLRASHEWVNKKKPKLSNENEVKFQLIRKNNIILDDDNKINKSVWTQKKLKKKKNI